MRPLADCRLYTFVDSAYLRGRPSAEICRMLCDGGSDLIQLRAKDWPLERIRATALELAPICAAAGVWFVVNDHPGVALEVSAPLCHVGQEDFFDAGHTRVDSLFGAAPAPRPGVGLSSHAPAQALRAAAAGAAYVAVGPVYATGTKPGALPVTLDYVRWAAREIAIPWFAIGGVNLDRLGEVLDAGATRVCVVSAILDQEDPAAACRAFRDRLG